MINYNFAWKKWFFSNYKYLKMHKYPQSNNSKFYFLFNMSYTVLIFKTKKKKRKILGVQ